MNDTKSSPLPEKPRFRVLIAGFGLISPLGGSAWQTFASLLAGKTLADRARQLPADIAVTDLVRATGAVIFAQHSATDPSVDLAERASREAAVMAGVDTGGLPAFVGASKGAVHALSAAFGSRCKELHRSALDAPPPKDADLAVALGPHGYLNHHLQRRLGLSRITHHVAACASSLTALHYARQQLLSGDSDHVLVTTSEASLLPQFIHSYLRLGVLATPTPEGYAERPLNCERQGFVLCEAGAAVLLRRVPFGEDPMPGETELLETATACEAHDLIRSSPDMPALRHIAQRMFANHTVDVIHPHAPGTPDHDPAELSAYADVVHKTNQPDEPLLYACKGALGHGLGAAGLTALVIACLCAKSRRTPPMPWLTAPIETALRLNTQGSNLKPSTTHAVFAAGFAGHTAGAVIRHH